MLSLSDLANNPLGRIPHSSFLIPWLKEENYKYLEEEPRDGSGLGPEGPGGRGPPSP